MSLEKLQNLKELASTFYGSRWYKANLHVHALGQNPDEIIDAAMEAELDLVAITDHNTFKYCKAVQETAAKKTDNKIIVLPGIEITLEEGAHILAIFDTDFDESKQTHFLGKINIPIEGSARTPVRDRTCSQVLTEITDAKGITVVPHPFSDDIGFLDRARKMATRLAWLESGNIGLIQLPKEKVKYVGYDEEGKWQNRFILASTPPSRIPTTDYCLSPISAGEAKTPPDINNGAVWLKLGSRTVRGLRQVTCEPNTCISYDEPQFSKTSYLLGLTVKGGFFNGLKLGLSSDFSCIFGENHSGKTAIFDFISFALGRDITVLSHGRDEELEILLRRLDAILQPDGEIDLFLSQTGHIYCLSRKFIPHYDRYSNVTGVQDQPEAFRYDPDNDKLIPVELEEAVFMPEIYSQGHVGILRRSIPSQLALIDELAGITDLRSEKEKLKHLLKENADELAELYGKRESLAGLIGNLPELRTEYADNIKHLGETDYQLWENTGLIIGGIDTRIQELDPEVKDVTLLKSKFSISISHYEEKDVIHFDLLNSISGVVDGYNKSISSAISQAKDAYDSLQKSLAPLFKKWEEELGEHNQKIAQLLRRKGFASPEQLLRRISAQKSEIDDIEKIHLPGKVHVDGQIKTLKKKRDDLLQQYGDICSKIKEARNSKIEELNQLIAPDMRISLEKSNLKAYLEVLEDVYSDISSQGSRLQRREEQLNLIINKVSPSELVEAIINKGKFKKSDGDITTLVDASSITWNTQQVLCTITGAIQSLHKLQVFELEPEPKISVRREGTEVFADLRTELSPGEQSSAILTLALMARDVPLIIDQPEDELGYSYIVNKIVPKILESKRKRQVILISHNANIPVLADSEYLIKVRNDPSESQSSCTIELSGTFANESVCNKILELEGGERAFEIRQYRYAIPRRIEEL
jgi:DNA repair ATPase RecN